MNDPFKLRFKISGSHTPETMPAVRLLEYLDKLLRLLGDGENVHVVGIKKGSTAPVLLVDKPAIESISERASQLRGGNAAPELRKLFYDLNDCLARNGHTAALNLSRGKRILAFPGSKLPQSAIGPISSDGTLDGTLTRIGGRQGRYTAQVQDFDDEPHTIEVTREQAKQLATHLFETPLRFFGTGKWVRTRDGIWNLESYRVASFAVLNDDSLRLIVEKIRETGTKAWDGIADPNDELKDLRYGRGEHP